MSCSDGIFGTNRPVPTAADHGRVPPSRLQLDHRRMQGGGGWLVGTQRQRDRVVGARRLGRPHICWTNHGGRCRRTHSPGVRSAALNDRLIYLTEDPKEAGFLLDTDIVGCGSEGVEQIRWLGDTFEHGARRSRTTTVSERLRSDRWTGLHVLEQCDCACTFTPPSSGVRRVWARPRRSASSAGTWSTVEPRCSRSRTPTQGRPSVAADRGTCPGGVPSCGQELPPAPPDLAQPRVYGLVIFQAPWRMVTDDVR